MQQPTTRKKTTRKKTHRIAKAQVRPTIEPTRIYSRPEAALACGVGQITLFRAYDAGHLKAYRQGSRVSHSGQHLLDWMESGGRTGRTKEDVERELAGVEQKRAEK
jgi:hypothetical protein